jgi:hypothetical protein
MVKFLSHGSKTALDIAQAFTVSQLGERHRQKLIIAGKRTNSIIATIAIDALTKFFLRKEVHHLRKNALPLIHCSTPFAREGRRKRSMGAGLIEFQVDPFVFIQYNKLNQMVIQHS